MVIKIGYDDLDWLCRLRMATWLRKEILRDPTSGYS